MLHNFWRFTTFVLAVSPSEILFYHYTLTCSFRHMNTFGINSIKSYDTYLDIEITPNEKSLNYKIVDLKKY
jgi:hypothetical protein